MKPTAIVSYKTKVKTMSDGRKYIDYKKLVGRSDCNLKPCDHLYYNSDLFVSMLKRALSIEQQGREWQYLDCIPASVKVDESKFLAVVTITLPQEFVR